MANPGIIPIPRPCRRDQSRIPKRASGRYGTNLYFVGLWFIPVAFLIIFCTNSHRINDWTTISFIKNRQNQRFLIKDLDLSSYSIYPISVKFIPNSHVNVHCLLDCRKTEIISHLTSHLNTKATATATPHTHTMVTMAQKIVVL